MIAIDRLKGLIVERGFSQRRIAKAMGITDNTFYRKMKLGVFTSDEMSLLVILLNIENPVDIFFAELGTR